LEGKLEDWRDEASRAGGVGVASAFPGGGVRDEDALGVPETQGSGPSEARVVLRRRARGDDEETTETT
jgi:hypothetical protein